MSGILFFIFASCHPLRKPFSYRIFKIFAPYISTLNTTIFQQKKNICTVSKWRPNNQFSLGVISISVKIWKTIFPKEFSSETWLKLGDHKYVNIAAIEFGHFYSGVIFFFFRFFFCTAKMLFYVTTRPIAFFFTKRLRNVFLIFTGGLPV